MAYVPGYKYDIFISYPIEADADGWVHTFHRDFKIKLDESLPGNKIYFDASEYKAAQNTKRILEDAARSAMFVPILVPAYLQEGKFAGKELAEFCKNCGEEDRIAIVEKIPVSDALPRLLTGPKRNKFYQEEEPCGTLQPGTADYNTQLTFLARQLGQRLKELREQYRKTIILAKATDDVREYLESVAEDLQEFGFTVLSQQNQPDDRRSFEAQFKADLTRADLFVQLLGEEDQPIPDGLSLSEFQVAEARAVGVRVVQWAAPYTNPARVTRPAYRRLLDRPDVLVMTLNEFKRTIKELLRSDAPPPEASRDSGIYIAADQADAEYVEQLKKLVIDSGFKDYEILKSQANLADLKSVIETAYAFVLLQGNAEPQFITNWLRNYRRLRLTSKKHPVLEALLYAPPPTEDKERPPDVNFDGLNRFLPPEPFPHPDFEQRLRERLP